MGALLPVRQQDGCCYRRQRQCRGQGTRWAPLSSFPADPVTSGVKATKAPGSLERKCDSFLLGKTDWSRYVGTLARGWGGWGREAENTSLSHTPAPGARTAVPE